MPSAVPDCPVESAVETDPKKIGDQGEPVAEYLATEESAISVNPFEDTVPNVVRPKPGDALSESQGTGRNCNRTLNACSLRPPVNAIAPAVTPPENCGEVLPLSDRELSAGLSFCDCPNATLAPRTMRIARMSSSV